MHEPKKKKSILVVEDNLTNQKVALAMLKRMGYAVDAVANGKEALETLARTPYDLVLMDCQMPVLDGYAAARAIRDPGSDVMNHSIPVVAMTAHAMKGDREKCLAAGMDDYLTKPISAKTLKDVLEEWMNDESTADDAMPAETPSAAADWKGKIFDRETLLEQLSDDEEMLDEIVGDYMEDIPRQIAGVKKGLAEGNPDLIKQHAHTIKGSSGSIRALVVQKVALAIEKAVEQGKQESISALVTQLEMQLDAFAEAANYQPVT